MVRSSRKAARALNAGLRARRVRRADALFFTVRNPFLSDRFRSGFRPGTSTHSAVQIPRDHCDTTLAAQTEATRLECPPHPESIAIVVCDRDVPKVPAARNHSTTSFSLCRLAWTGERVSMKFLHLFTIGSVFLSGLKRMADSSLKCNLARHYESCSGFMKTSVGVLKARHFLGRWLR